MAKRARLSVDQVVVALDRDEESSDFEEDCDIDEVIMDGSDIDEPIMEGSDDEFGELDDELRDLIEAEEESEDENEMESAYSQEEIELPKDWSTDVTHVNIPSFTSEVGPNLAIPDTVLGVFQLYFTPHILAEITSQSNLYACQVLGDDTDRYKPMSVDELKAYLGFCMLMAINHLPATEDYWKRDKVFNYSPVSSRISRDRFRELSRYLHFIDNSTLPARGDPDYDRLGKIRPLIQHLSAQFQAVYSPHRDVAVDEAMIKFQGRFSLKQYMPLKPTKRGIKVWVLADSHNGYFWRFEVYTGKQGDTVQKGLGAQVVKSLTQELKGKNFHVYFDNFFNSFDLLNDLVLDNIYACGTARSNRKGFPDALKNVKFPNRYPQTAAYGRHAYYYMCISHRCKYLGENVYRYICSILPRFCPHTDVQHIHAYLSPIVCIMHVCCYM